MIDAFSFPGDTLTASDLANLRELARHLTTVQHAVAAEWSQELMAAQPEQFAEGVMSIEELTRLNESFLGLILRQIEAGELDALNRIYYESTRGLLEADLQRAPARPIALV